MSGDWDTACVDGGTWVASDGSSEVACSCGCDDAPSAVADIGEAFGRIIEELAESGSVYDGPLRVAARDLTPDEPDGGSRNWQPWPLARAVSEIVIDWGDHIDATSGLLVEAPDEVASLRTLRAEYLASFGSIPVGADAFLPVTDNGRYYALVVRDVVPWDPASP